MLDGEAVLLVPKEVVRELHIQSFTLSEKENNKIAGLLKLCTEEDLQLENPFSELFT